MNFEVQMDFTRKSRFVAGGIPWQYPYWFPILTNQH